MQMAARAPRTSEATTATAPWVMNHGTSGRMAPMAKLAADDPAAW